MLALPNYLGKRSSFHISQRNGHCCSLLSIYLTLWGKVPISHEAHWFLGRANRPFPFLGNLKLNKYKQSTSHIKPLSRSSRGMRKYQMSLAFDNDFLAGQAQAGTANNAPKSGQRPRQQPGSAVSVFDFCIFSIKFFFRYNTRSVISSDNLCNSAKSADEKGSDVTEGHHNVWPAPIQVPQWVILEVIFSPV